jgi:integrase
MSGAAPMLDQTSDNLQLSEAILPPPVPTNPLLPADLDSLDPKIRQFVAAAISPNTRRAYASDVDHFLAWGGCLPATSETIARYLAHHAEALSTATLARRLAAIRHAHAVAGLPNPTANDLVRITLRGIRRTYGRAQQRVAALTKGQLVAITTQLGTSIKDTRDRALLLIGFAGAFRRSELVALDCNAIDRRAAGLVITIRKSKTDQDRRGRQVAIPYSRGAMCPIRALDDWLDLARITEGPVFRPVTKRGDVLIQRLSAEAVAVIVKQRTKSFARKGARYSGHSLRVGFVTSAALDGIPTWRIRAQTGHASEAALCTYIRNSELFLETGSG